MKFGRWILLVCCAALLLTGCAVAGGGSSEEELYDMGMDLITVMDEMTHNDDYLQILGGEQVIKSGIHATIYREPLAVYRVYMGDMEEILEIATKAEREQWDRLPEKLQEQLEQRVTFSMIANIINSRWGTSAISYSALFSASQEAESLQLEEDVHYLYVVSENTAVAVTFSKHGTIQGSFVFVEQEALEEVLEECKCTLKQLDFK